MFPIDLSGQNGIVFGVANERSIAWSISQALSQAGARLALTYQGERFKDRVEKLAEDLHDPLLLPCDATNDQDIDDVFSSLASEFGEVSFLIHSIAFANRDDLSGRFSETGREGFRVALEVSAYSPSAVGPRRGAPDDRRRQCGGHDVRRLAKGLPRLQCDGNGESSLGKQRSAVGVGVRAG